MVTVEQLPQSRIHRFAGELRPVTLAIGLAFGLGVGVVPAANAGIITVNNLSGASVGGQCTLRDAVLAAKNDAVVQGCAAGSGADTINFSVTGTISLATSIVVDSAVTINGPGASSLTLAPSGTQSALYVGSITNPAVTISGVTFQGNGTSTVSGAGIFHYGGVLTIQNCVFTGNSTTSDGGALYSGLGNVIIQSSTFSGNHAQQRGGAIFMYTGTLSIDQSTLSGNTSGNDGGAIAFYSDGGTPGVLVITNSTLSGNSATGVNHNGGAVFMYNTAPSSIANSTISGNSATGHGGGVYLDGAGSMTIINSTITGNSATTSGGGVYLYNTTLNLTSTIVAGNNSPSGPDIEDFTGGTVNASNSLIQVQSGWTLNSGGANIIGVSANLGPLANNGGPTFTHALLTGSPAIDTGSNPLALATDQRGVGFPRTVGAATDIGAFEVQGAGPAPVAVVPVPTLSQWGVGLLSVLMAGWAMLTGFGRRRRS